MRSFFKKAAELEDEGHPFVLATVTNSGGSTPRAAGARMLICADAQYGTVGGGALELTVIDSARSMLTDPTRSTETVSVHLVRDLGMCCGGQMSVFLEKIEPEPRLIIFGAGHVATMLAQIAQLAHFKVTVVDDRPEWCDSARFPSGVSACLTDPEDYLRETPLNEHDFVAVMTHSHALDETIIRKLADQPLRYLGMIGSRGKWARFKKRLGARAVSEGHLSRVVCPIGVDIAALTPAEIAISVVAQLVASRRSIHTQ